jgi:hypothetical protein
MRHHPSEMEQTGTSGVPQTPSPDQREPVQTSPERIRTKKRGCKGGVRVQRKKEKARLAIARKMAEEQAEGIDAASMPVGSRDHALDSGVVMSAQPSGTRIAGAPITTDLPVHRQGRPADTYEGSPIGKKMRSPPQNSASSSRTTSTPLSTPPSPNSAESSTSRKEASQDPIASNDFAQAAQLDVPPVFSSHHPPNGPTVQAGTAIASAEVVFTSFALAQSASHSRDPNEDGAHSDSSSTTDSSAYQPAREHPWRPHVRALRGQAKRAKQLEMEQAFREKEKAEQEAQQARGVAGSLFAAATTSGPGIELLRTPRPAKSAGLTVSTATGQALARRSFQRHQEHAPTHKPTQPPQNDGRSSHRVVAATSQACPSNNHTLQVGCEKTSSVASFAAGTRQRSLRDSKLDDHAPVFKQTHGGLDQGNSSGMKDYAMADNKRRNSNAEMTERSAAMNATAASASSHEITLGEALQPSEGSHACPASTKEELPDESATVPSPSIIVPGNGERRLCAALWARPVARPQVAPSGMSKGREKYF